MTVHQPATRTPPGRVAQLGTTLASAAGRQPQVVRTTCLQPGPQLLGLAVAGLRRLQPAGLLTLETQERLAGQPSYAPTRATQLPLIRAARESSLSATLGRAIRVIKLRLRGPQATGNDFVKHACNQVGENSVGHSQSATQLPREIEHDNRVGLQILAINRVQIQCRYA